MTTAFIHNSKVLLQYQYFTFYTLLNTLHIQCDRNPQSLFQAQVIRRLLAQLLKLDFALRTCVFTTRYLTSTG